MLGSILALLAAMSFSLNKVVIRRAVVNVSDATIGILISVPTAIPLFFLILILENRVDTIFSFSWEGYFWMSLAGILHFVIGRGLNYKCVQLVGANLANILSRADIPTSVVIGVFWLKEPLSWRLILGVSAIIVGITLAGLNTRMIRDKYSQLTKIPPGAFVFGFGCGLAWGIAPIFVKLGLRNSDSPTAGALISFSAAALFLFFSLLKQKKRSALIGMPAGAAGFFLIGGLFSCAANLLRYIALGLAPASVVTPLVSITPIFGLIFAFIFNRNIEIFSRPVIIGTVTVVVGTIILI